MSAEQNEAKQFTEYDAIKKAIAPYIESAKTGVGATARKAFFDHAHIVGSVNGDFANMTADVFAGAVDSGGPSPEVQHHIAWIDVSGPAAAVKLEFINWTGFRFTDYFVLYKQDGEWKISGKVFNSHSKN